MNNQKKYLIAQLLKITNEWNVYKLSADHAFFILRARYKNVSEQEFDKLSKELGFEHYLDKIVDIYDKYLTSDDIKSLTAFYTSPLGKKIGNTMLLNELSNVAKNWAETLNEKCFNLNGDI